MVGVDFNQLLTFEPQHHWGVGVAIYLFLGGLGGAMVFLAVMNKMLLKRDDPSMYAWSTILGIILVNFGALFLLMDMFIWDSFWHGHILEILKVIYATFGAAVFNGNLHPWIQIGAVTVGISSAIGLLWALTMADRAAILKHIPILVKLANVLKPFEGILGWILLVFSTVLAFYTGFLLSVAPSIPSWSHPLLPVLFFISALSTGTAWYMLWTFFAKGKDEQTQEVRKKIAYQSEWGDIVLIGLELLAILAYFNYLYYANGGGKYVFNLMISDMGFIGLFLILGLIVPWILEMIAGVKHSFKFLIPVAALLVLFGGFLLRYYILHYGIYAYPWPS